MKPRFSLPASDELEVSVFGPRRGECVVVHVPDGPWFIVDSLALHPGGGRSTVPIATAYLKDGLGVSSVYGVFLTHWHGDHTEGAAELLRDFAGALKVVGLPSAFGKRELASFIGDLLPNAATFKLVKDLVGVLSVLLNEPSLQDVRQLLLSDGVELNPPGASWRLRALSPSTEDVRHHLATLAEFLPRQGSSGRFDVNSACAVLCLEVGSVRVMLASDLDVGDGAQRGWQCIVKNHTVHNVPLESIILKIGHHGSRTSFHAPAIQAIAGSGRLHGVVTPFPAQGDPLPRSNEMKKYRTLCTRLHQTGSARAVSRAGKVAVKNTPFSAYAPSNVANLSAVGQVRYRMRAGEKEPRVEVFAPAFAVA